MLKIDTIASFLFTNSSILVKYLIIFYNCAKEVIVWSNAQTHVCKSFGKKLLLLQLL